MSKVGRRYAKALFEVCLPQNYDAIRQPLLILGQAISTNAELRDALTNPARPVAERLSTFLGLFKDVHALSNSQQPQQEVVSFLTVIFENGRLRSTLDIAQEFDDLVTEIKKLLKIEIESAQTLPSADLEKIQTDLQSKYKHLITTTVRVNSDLISGVRVRIGDALVDSTVRGRLEKLRGELLS